MGGEEASDMTSESESASHPAPVAEPAPAPDSSTEPAPHLVVGAALVADLTNPSGVLATQRSYPEWADGLWEFPGGKVEPGETPREALHREISEELGCGIDIGRQLANPDSPDGSWDLSSGEHNAGLRMMVWLARPFGEITLGPAHRDARVLTAAELDSVEWLPGDIQILPVLRAALGGH